MLTKNELKVRNYSGFKANNNRIDWNLKNYVKCVIIKCDELA